MSAHRIVMSVSAAVLLLGAGWGVGIAGANAATTTEHATQYQAAASTVEQSSAPTLGPATGHSPPTYSLAPSLKCVQASSSGSTSCNDAGNVASRCAVAKCGTGYTLTGGGGSCAAGNRKIKALNPNLSANEFHIMCEDQGVAPLARAICCKL